MQRQFTTSYENIGATSYLAAAFLPGAEIINYQLEMAAENRIEHVLPVKKQTKNGNIVVYYNITSKIALSQILERKKLNRREILRLLEGAVAAIRDAGEYQLPQTGLLMEAEYIFVDPATCDPAFVFLPVSDPSAKSLRELVIDLVMQGKVEMSNDNFIQKLLEAVNAEPLSFDGLEQCIADFKEKKETVQNIVNHRETPVMKKMEPVPAPVPTPAPVSIPAAEMKNEPEMHGRIPAVPERKNIGNPKKEKKEKKQKKNSGAKWIKMLLPQVLLLALVAAAYLSGLFFDEAGGINTTNLGALGGCILLVEFVLYRENFVNKKDGSETEEKGKKAGKKTKAPKAPKNSKVPKAPKAPKAPAMPLPADPIPEVRKAEDIPFPVPEKIPEMKKFEIPREIPISVPAYAPREEEDGETEIWTGEENGISVCLEYWENGMVSRIPLDKPSILLGRLSGQVDFAVSNPKVGKIHAEIIQREGNVYIKDLSSKNGVYINGNPTRISSNAEYLLNLNDRFKLADSEFILRQI